MDAAWITISVLALVVGVLAYGFAGAQLHTGSQAEGGSLRSRAWWTGTGLQGLGFLATLVARRSLPVLIVQASSSAGLAVTAAIQHLTGHHRLTRRATASVAAIVAGLGLIAMGTQPGAATQIRPAHEWLLAACLLVCGAGVALRPPAFVSGLLSGLGFAYAAIGARLVMGDTRHPLWVFWHLPLATWIIGLLTGTGIVLGQLHLTRGLSRSDAAPVLAAMYLVETLFPAAVGASLLDEHARHGMLLPLLLGLVAAMGGAVSLARSQG